MSSLENSTPGNLDWDAMVAEYDGGYPTIGRYTLTRQPISPLIYQILPPVEFYTKIICADVSIKSKKAKTKTTSAGTLLESLQPHLVASDLFFSITQFCHKMIKKCQSNIPGCLCVL